MDRGRRTEMEKILIIRWIIMHCDSETFLGMRWENRDEGIFWLYWKHQSSRSCRENNAESAALYEYYRAWARHKNNKRSRQPRDLKAAFRNALEKKEELIRLTHMDTKERIYWQIKDFPNDRNESCAPIQLQVKKPKSSNRGRKSHKIVVPNSSENNLKASTSSVSEDVTRERKKPRKPPVKRGKKSYGEAQKSLPNIEVLSLPHEPPASHEVENNPSSLPHFIEVFPIGHVNSSWDDSLKNLPRSHHTWDDPLNNEYKWTPQMPHTPPQYPSDLMEVSSTEMMDPFIPDQMNYSLQPTPPPEADILLGNITDADLMIIGKLINEGVPTILKSSFPFQQEEMLTYPSHLTNTRPATSLHCSLSDFESVVKATNVQSNDCVLDSRTPPPQNAFLFDKKQQCFHDQVVPPYSEAFQGCRVDEDANASEIFVNDCFLYSPPPVPTHGQFLEEMCHQRTDTGCPSVEMFRYNNQTSHDDSGISDMEDFLDCTDKILDDIDSRRQSHHQINQYHEMC